MTNTLGKKYPHKWVSGPDPVLHKKYRVWVQQRNQANFRGEGWTFTFEDWVDFWGDNFDQRGKEKSSLCMTRKDNSQPWHKDNVKIITRDEHFAQNRNKEGRFATREN